MDWKEYLSLSLSLVITSSCACQVFTLSGPSSREQLIRSGMTMNSNIRWGRLICSFDCLFQLCSVRFGEVTSSSLWRWCVIEVTQVCGFIRNDCRGFNNLSYTIHLRHEYMYFLFNRTTLQVFVTYLIGALYMHPLWFYKHQHDKRVRSKLFVACQRWWFHWWFWFVPSVLAYLREEEEHKPDPWCNPIERNKKIHIFLSQVYCVWQVVKTPTIISNNPVFFICLIYHLNHICLDTEPVCYMLFIFKTRWQKNQIRASAQYVESVMFLLASFFAITHQYFAYRYLPLHLLRLCYYQWKNFPAIS